MITVDIFDTFIEVHMEDRSYTVECSTDALPLKDESVKVIRCHDPKKDGFCEEYGRVLKNEGLLTWQTR